MIKKYTIYHIIGVKIGVSDNLKRRMSRQGFTDWEILEEHTDIYEVSNREIQLQIEYGYPLDNIPYWKTVENAIKGGASNIGRQAWNIGIPRSLECKRKSSESQKGKIVSEEARRNLSKALKGKTPKNIQCPHCSKVGGNNVMKRWHFDKCKNKI